ncbi:unnamed protein product [Polarella glacialis]|uniref:Uncharacterized protein n=1 Tax=Polarella glacialis TaxID=89957 RepID=A0A813GS54_POLGL|nr:unnamed protein product [Polarella glacialis]CAE8655899.1 unnamed protein product [Polarella glacialis]
MHDLQSTPLVESSPDAATQSSGESRAARRRKLRQAHLERLRSDNLVLLGAADDSSGSLRREPLSEGTVNTMQGDASVGPTITWALPSSGVPKFNPELRSVWGEYAVALNCAQRKQLQQKALSSKAHPASEAEWEAATKEGTILFFQLKFLDDPIIRKECVNLLLSPRYSGLYGRCERHDLQQELKGGPRYK